MPSAVLPRIVSSLCLVLPTLSLADPFDPLPTYNQGPFAQIYGLPAFDAPRLIAPGQRQIRVGFEAANYFFSRHTDTEVLILDGETHRAALTFKYATARAEWGIEVPHLSHSGGFLDSFIEGWHDAFGLPNGGREGVATGELRYVYQRNGAPSVRVSDRTSGVGDVRLLAGWSLFTDADAAVVALRASLKLPTGDSESLLGSGAADLATWVSAGCAAARCAGAWRWNASAGALVLGRGEVIGEQQRRFVAFGGLGGGWRPWEPLIFKAELRAHTPFYRDTEMAPLGTTATQIILGGTWRVSKETAFDVAISEDLRVNTAPDVSLLISFRSSF